MFILFMYLWRKYFVDIPNTTLFSEVKVNNVFYKKCYMEKTICCEKAYSIKESISRCFDYAQHDRYSYERRCELMMLIYLFFYSGNE